MEELAPGVRRLALRTPTLPPATHTNCLLVGEQEFVVIEPATPHEGEQARLFATIDARVSAGHSLRSVLITHHHSDHVGAAVAVAERYAVPIAAHEQTRRRVDFEVQHILEPDTRIELLGGHQIRCVYTPGHAPGHLVFVHEPTQIAHAGDMVAGEGTILIDPDDSGDLSTYLESLHALRALKLRALVPAHGPTLADPQAILSYYIAHRMERERKVLAALSLTPRSLDEIVPQAYDDKPPQIWPLAKHALRAHLQKLVADGLVARAGDGRHYLPQAPS